MSDRVARLENLPARVAASLSDFLGAARDALSADLASVVLFGSAADGRLGPTSDINLILVLQAFSPDKMVRLRDALQAAEAAINLRVMWVLENELPAAAELFAQKFADIRRRYRVLAGRDVIAGLPIPRTAEIFRLRQILLNVVLRLREAYVARSQRPEQIAYVLADMLGPLRAASATLLELEGKPASDSSAAFTSVAASFGPDGKRAAERILAAHDGGASELPHEQALVDALALAANILQRAEGLV